MAIGPRCLLIGGARKFWWSRLLGKLRWMFVYNITGFYTIQDQRSYIWTLKSLHYPCTIPALFLPRGVGNWRNMQVII